MKLSSKSRHEFLRYVNNAGNLMFSSILSKVTLTMFKIINKIYYKFLSANILFGIFKEIFTSFEYIGWSI
jgi:hypothetical protein